jgi:hypothetical protein
MKWSAYDYHIYWNVVWLSFKCTQASLVKEKTECTMGTTRMISATRHIVENKPVALYSTTVSETWPVKHAPAEKNTHATIDLLLKTGCFLCGPWWYIMRRIVWSKQFSWALQGWLRRDGATIQVKIEKRSVREAVKKKVNYNSTAVERTHMWCFYCVIQWDCYSSSVKICCQETASRECNRLRTPDRVCQCSVKCNYELCVNVLNKSKI